jgi:hypothetical protein
MEKVIKDGTILTIDSDFTEMVDNAVEDGTITIRQHEIWCSTVYEEWLPRHIQFHAVRVDRKSIFLAWYFLGGDLASSDHFDLSIFKALGFEIIEPKQEELELCNCPDQYLGSRELVHKYLILQNPGHARSYCNGILRMVENAMGVNGIVFYRP